VLSVIVNHADTLAKVVAVAGCAGGLGWAVQHFFVR
jgi:hypothetical protein